jgi:23S rRNA (guanosine2251-2'-O)-methyltransferase
MADIIVIAHNIRSTHNVGSIFRTSEGFGVSKIIISGYTPHPLIAGDKRLPHITEKLTSQIHKTALGAESIVPFEYEPYPNLEKLRTEGYKIIALEQDTDSIILNQYQTPDKVALIIGEEVRGVDKALLNECDDIVEIPMSGKKESFNVSVATGIALYHLSLAH